MKTGGIAVALIAVGVGAYVIGQGDKAPSPVVEQQDVTPVTSEMVAVKMPDLDPSLALGQRAFTAKCSACHGPSAGGVLGAGPPLIHKIYEPSHHSDEAFYRAAELGVRAHHWQFGDMPPVEGITRAETREIIAFLRDVQRENGIN